MEVEASVDGLEANTLENIHVDVYMEAEKAFENGKRTNVECNGKLSGVNELHFLGSRMALGASYPTLYDDVSHLPS